MAGTIKKIGIIAGGGRFPLLFANAVRKKGIKAIIIAHRDESSPELESAADSLYWVRLGQLGRIIKHLKQEDIHEAVLLGTITKTNIFRDVRPDLRGLGLWNKINARQDDAILRAVADELQKEDIQIVASTSYLKDLLFPKGVITRKEPTAGQLEDIRFGWQIARQIGALDIGQCVVVRNRTVLAVEAIEGTDAAIKRGGKLGHEKTVVVKIKKPNQDFRFDLPAVGETTIESMVTAKAAVLAVEAGQALLFDMEGFTRAADAAGIVVVGIEEDEDGTLVF